LAPRWQPSQKIVVAVVYVSAMLLNTLDATMINVALSTLAREFGVSPAAIESVVIGYLVSLAVFIPASGWLGDRFGSKRTFMIALTVFTAASLASGFATSLPMLVAFRVLQGVGGGMLTPVGMAMLYRTFPPQERVAVSRVLMFAIILGPALGPIIGGAILAAWSWPWIFFAKIPLAVAALTFGLLFLHEHREEEAGGFDLAGFLLAGVGFASVMYALSQGPQHGWTTTIVGLLAAGLSALAAFVLVELRQPQPMIDLRLLGNRLFRTTMMVSFFGSAAFLGVLFMVPIFLQEVVRLSPLQTGISVAPEAVGVIVATQFVARIYPHVGPRRLMMTGLMIAAVAILLMSTMRPETNVWLIRGFMFTLGSGMAFIFLPNQVASLATITRRDTGRATTLTNVQRQLGSALGVALLSTVLSSVGVVVATSSGTTEPNLAAYRAAFYVAAGIALIGAFVAWRVPDEEAAETMVPKGVGVAKPSQTARPAG
jgi:EmrB/QacA subfamily drug resistance transporter